MKILLHQLFCPLPQRSPPLRPLSRRLDICILDSTMTRRRAWNRKIAHFCVICVGFGVWRGKEGDRQADWPSFPTYCRSTDVFIDNMIFCQHLYAWQWRWVSVFCNMLRLNTNVWDWSVTKRGGINCHDHAKLLTNNDAQQINRGRCRSTYFRQNPGLS